MRKILALMLAVIMIVGIFALPVAAEESVTVLNENFGKVKIMGKVQTSYNGSTAYAVRSSFGESETQDIIQYFVRNTNQDSGNGMELNPAFDFYSVQRLVSKNSSTVFENTSIYGGDERTPVSLSGFGWIGATHGMTCGVTVTSANHGLTYSAIGNIYKDPAGIEWVLLRVSSENMLVFISKNLSKGDATKPTFYSTMGATLTNVENEDEVIKVDSYKSGQQLRPAYKMDVQNIYVVNGEEKTLVDELGKTYEGDYVLVEEEYTIMNPVYVAQAIIDQRPEGGYTENPSLAVGKGLVTFDLQQIYNPDGTVIHNWETTYLQDVTMSEWGGIQYGAKGDYIYLPLTKPFVAKSNVSNVVVESMAFDFSNIFDTTTGYPSSDISPERWADSSYAPNRRLDFGKKDGVFNKAFAGGYIPVYDNENSERIQNITSTNYMYLTRKAYFYSTGSKLNTRYPDLTGITLKGSAYKKWIEDYDAEGNSSYYSVPYFSDDDNSRYMYFDLYKPGVTKKYDVSAYLGTYSISELEKTANLEYDINYETGILTVSSKENGQKSADSLVLKAKYVGESVPAVEMKLRALPELYSESINDKLAEIAEMMESVGADISDYNPALIEKYNSLLTQKEAYEQALKDEAANADRVAGLNNRYDFVDMKFVYDVFATENDIANAKWAVTSTAEVPNIYAFKGFVSGMTSIYPSAGNKNAYKTEKIAETSAITQDKDGNDILTVGNIPFKLGKIARNDGEVGANAWIGRVEYAPELFDDQSKLPVFDASVHGTISTQTATATYQINKDGISDINIVSSVNSSSGGIKFLNVKIKYENEKEKTVKYVIGKSKEKFEDGIFAIEKTKFEELSSNPNYTVGMVEGTSDGSSGWTYKVKDDAYYAVQHATKYYQLKNNPTDYPIQKLNTLMTVDLSKISDNNPNTEIYFPVASEKFVPSTLIAENYVHNVKIPTDPLKKIETIAINSNIEHGGPIAEESGGFYDRGEWNVSQGAVILKYDGKDTVTVDDKEYVIFIDLNRECQESSFFGMTLTRAQTWLDRIATVEAKMLALSATSSTYAEVEAIREEIKSLLSQNTSIVYIKDFSEAARTNIDNVEATLKAEADEEERIENLSKNVFNHVDMNKYGREDLYAFDQDVKTVRQFGYSNTLTGILAGCNGVDKTDGDVAYKEYYTKDNHLFAVLDVANNTYYYNGDSTYDKDAYSFLGKTYQFKYNAGEKKYYYKSKGAEKSSTSSQGNLYAWYHDNVGAYYEKSTFAQNKTIVGNNSLVNADTLLAELTDVKEYTAKDKITGNEIKAKTGTLKAENGTEFTVGPFAPSKTVTASGIMLSTQNVVVPFGENGVKADYINLLANAFISDAVNTSYWTVEVNYENEDGSLGKKTFALVLPKSGYKDSTNTSAQGVIDNSIFKVAKDKAQATYDNVFANKEATTGISIDDIKFNTKVEGLMIYPSEMVYVGKKYTQHSWYPNPFDNYAGVFKIPVSDLYKVISVNAKANGGASGYANKATSDLYVEGSMVASNGRAAIPVEVKNGDPNYNYYAIYSPNWETRSVLYAVNTEKTPAQDKIDAIEEMMQNATLKDIAEIEKLYNNLTFDGSVKESDFDKDILTAYNEFKEKSDVTVVADKFEVKQDGENVVIKAVIANPTKLEGKKFTIVAPFYKGENVIATKVYSFTSTKEAEITKEIKVTEVPEGTSDVKVLIWKDLTTLKPLSAY